ncbi:MAG: response regulator [Candidatus Omnitrophica bacterium]|nr:response regulator [Candidatus Omnitrophota bacterium]
MPKKILIIDDELDNIKIVVYRLQSQGYEVLSALAGWQGIEMAKIHKPDLIFLDYHLPEIEAPDAVRQIRSVEGNEKVPIILFTADIPRMSAKVQDGGAVDYISKPDAPEILYAKVKKYLGI